VQQYRYAFSRATWEIPAGKRDPGEEPLATGIRELQEEVGLTAERWLPMGELIPSPGCYAERLYLFLARGLTMGDTHPDEDEFLTVSRVPFTDLYHACLSGEIQDAKTVVAVLKAKAMLGR
jgi:ADP-ribose pyrophosphatase